MKGINHIITPVFSIFLFVGLLVWTGCDSNNDPQGELIVEDMVEGSGVAAEAGHAMIVEFIGMLEDGKVVDTSDSLDQEFAFTLGVGQVIQGWDDGLLGMKEGGVRKLTIPPHLAFGSDGRCDAGLTCLVPPNATLIFEVTLVDILEDVVVEDLIIGTGDEAATNDYLTVEYTGTLTDGKVFDSTLFGTSFSFFLGLGEVIQGWETGLQGMRVGGRRRLIVPSHKAYSFVGSGSNIPPYAILFFVIDMTDLQKAEPAS